MVNPVMQINRYIKRNLFFEKREDKTCPKKYPQASAAMTTIMITDQTSIADPRKGDTKRTAMNSIIIPQAPAINAVM